MGQFVAVAYRPKENKGDELLVLLREHLPLLRKEELATNRPSLLMRAANGTIVELFEWCSEEAVEAAHSNRKVQEFWKRFDEVCDYECLANLDECKRPFSPFEPIDL